MQLLLPIQCPRWLSGSLPKTWQRWIRSARYQAIVEVCAKGRCCIFVFRGVVCVPRFVLVFFFPSFLYEPLNRLVCTICGTCVHTHPPFVFFYVAAHPSAHSLLTLTSALFHISFINMLFPILLFSQSDPMCIVYLKSQETGNQYREIVRNLVRYKARVSSLFCLISPKHITQP